MTIVKIKKKSDSPKTVAVDASDVISELVALRTKHDNEKKAHRNAIRSNVCEAYRIGRRLLKNNELWSAFLLEDWEGIKARPKADQQEQAVRFAIKFMVGPGDAMDKKASFYYRAVKAFADEDAKPKAVEKALKKYGFKKLASRQASKCDDANEFDAEVETSIKIRPATATKRVQQTVVNSPGRASTKSVEQEESARAAPTVPLGIKAELRFEKGAWSAFTSLKPMQGFKLKGVLEGVEGSVISVKNVKLLDGDSGS